MKLAKMTSLMPGIFRHPRAAPLHTICFTVCLCSTEKLSVQQVISNRGKNPLPTPTAGDASLVDPLGSLRPPHFENMNAHSMRASSASPAAQRHPMFERLDVNQLLRGRQALRALVQRERVDWVTVGKSGANNHIVALVDGGLRMMSFDSLPDDSWQISDQDTSDLILCATGEQLSHNVQRVLYASGDKIKSLMYRTRTGGEFEVVAVTRGGQVTVHAWDPLSVAWRFVSSVKIPLVLGEGGVVASAALAMDERHMYWFERKLRVVSGDEQQAGSDESGCSDNGSGSEGEREAGVGGVGGGGGGGGGDDDDDGSSDDGSSSSSGGEVSEAGGRKRIEKHRIYTLCCSRMKAGGRQENKRGGVEDLYDMEDILETGPTSRFEGEVALVSGIAVHKRLGARLLPAAPAGCWGIFSAQDNSMGVGCANDKPASRLAYFRHDMTACKDLRVGLPSRANHSPSQGCLEPVWCVSAGVAQTLSANKGDFVVLMPDGALLRHKASAKPGEMPTTDEMCSISRELAGNAVDITVVGGFYAIVTLDSTVLLVDGSSGEVRREVQLPVLGEKDRIYKGRHSASERPRWRAVGPIFAPSLVEIPGGSGAWQHSSRAYPVFWHKGLALWRIKRSALQGLSMQPPQSPKYIDAHTSTGAKAANGASSVSRTLSMGRAPSSPGGASHADADEDAHLVELMMSTWEKDDVKRASALSDEVLVRVKDPSLVLALIPAARRQEYAESRREKILGLASSLFPVSAKKLSSQMPPACPLLRPDADRGERNGWEIVSRMLSNPGEHLASLCSSAGIILKRGEGGVEVSVAVDMEKLTACARAWGCHHRKKESSAEDRPLLERGGPDPPMNLRSKKESTAEAEDKVEGKVEGKGSKVDCGQCASKSDRQVVCGSSPGGYPAMFGVLCRLIYSESPRHLMPLMEIVANAGCGAETYEAGSRLLPLTIDQGVLVVTSAQGGGGDDDYARIRAVCFVLKRLGRPLEGIRLLAEAGLWDQVKEAAIEVPAMGGGARRGAVLGAVLEGMEGWTKRAEGRGCETGGSTALALEARGAALEALAAISDIWTFRPG